MYDELPEALVAAFALVPTELDDEGLVALPRVVPVVPVAPLRVVPAAPDDVELLAEELAVLGDSVLIEALARMNEGSVEVVVRDLPADEVGAVVLDPLVPTAAF